MVVNISSGFIASVVARIILVERTTLDRVSVMLCIGVIVEAPGKTFTDGERTIDVPVKDG